MQREFGRLVKDEPCVDADLRTFLGRTCNLKAIADYESGPVRMCRQIERARLSRPRAGSWSA